MGGWLRQIALNAQVQAGLSGGLLVWAALALVACILALTFLLIAGFMVFVGRIAWWKSLLTAFLFSLAMFITFELAFDVIMPKGPLEAAFGF